MTNKKRVPDLKRLQELVEALLDEKFYPGLNYSQLIDQCVIGWVPYRIALRISNSSEEYCGVPSGALDLLSLRDCGPMESRRIAAKHIRETYLDKAEDVTTSRIEKLEARVAELEGNCNMPPAIVFDTQAGKRDVVTHVRYYTTEPYCGYSCDNGQTFHRDRFITLQEASKREVKRHKAAMLEICGGD